MNINRLSRARVRELGGLLKRKQITYPAILSVLLIVIWHYGVEYSGVSAYTMPQPNAILSALILDRSFYLASAFTSLKFIIAGYLTGILFGLIFAFLIFSSELLERALYSLLVVLFIIPKILIAPLLVLWFGAGPLYYTIVPLTLVFFPILENTLAGLNGVPEEMRYLSNILQSTKYFEFRRILIPHALPSIAAGLKIGMRQAVIGVIVAEFVAPEQGLGRILILGAQLGQPTSTWSGIIIIALLGITLYKIIEFAEQRFIFWKGDAQL